MIRRAVGVLALVCVLGAPSAARAGGTHELITRAVMNEAEGETYQSKLAHAFLFLNRRRAGLPLGSSGLDSEKVRERLARASGTAWADARRAVASAASNDVPDPTNGALYCENVRAFGVPAYIRRAGSRVEKCAKIGDVQFWRDSKK